MEKLKSQAKNKKIRFLWLKAFWATVKEGALAVFNIKPHKKNQKQKTVKEKPIKEKPFKQEKTHEKNERKPFGKLIMATDMILIAVFAVSALFCTISFLADDGREDITLLIDGKAFAYTTRAETVDEFLSNNNIELNSKDVLSCQKTDAIENGMTIAITRAFPVAVESQNKVVIVQMTEGTVGDALALAGIEYDTDDELSSLPFADVEEGMKITHTNVDIEYKTSYEELEFNEVTVKDSSMYKGQSKIVVQGENGEKLITRRVTYKDGFQFSREIVDQVILKKAKDQVTNIGSKIRYQTSYVGEWREYKAPPKAGVDGWVEMTVDYITAYSGDSVTAKGTKPKLGTIAVTPQYIPYYSQIYVENYGYGTALDTGAFRNRFENGKRVNQLDLFFNTEKECTRWGRKRNRKILVKLKK